MTESAHYEQLLRRNQQLADEVARLHRLLADAEDELAERRARQRREQQAASRYRAAWQSARRRAAAAQARLTELEEDEGDWLTNVLYARKMSILWGEPIISPAFTGDTARPIDQAEPVTLTARHLSYQRPACPGCEWAAHPPLTCDEVAAFRARFDGLLAEQLAQIQDEPRPRPAEPLGFLNTATSATRIVAHQCPRCFSVDPGHQPFGCDDVAALRKATDDYVAERDRLINEEMARTLLYGPEAQSCAGCGSPEVVYRNYLGTPLCCTCAACCEDQP